jgi:hypothetical protein
MKESNLKKSPVIFNEDGHTYTLDGKTLSGVTPIVAWLFPETYKGIPESILAQAAQYGGMIHKKIELADSMGIVDDPLVQAYIDIKEEKGVKTIANEFLVSDEKRIASSIDLLMEGNDIWDAKTTSKVHIPNVTIQTSIYAWLFEMQTGEKAGNLYCLWLPKPQYGQPELIPLKRVSADICQYIVEVWENGGDPMTCRAVLAQSGFEFERQRTEGDIPAGLQDLMDELIQIKTAKDQLDEREKAIKQVFLSQMQKDGVDKMGNDLIEFSRKAAYERATVDTTALKKKMPEVFESFKKVTKVAESITYKIL